MIEGDGGGEFVSELVVVVKVDLIGVVLVGFFMVGDGMGVDEGVKFGLEIGKVWGKVERGGGDDGGGGRDGGGVCGA